MSRRSAGAGLEALQRARERAAVAALRAFLDSAPDVPDVTIGTPEAEDAAIAVLRWNMRWRERLRAVVTECERIGI